MYHTMDLYGKFSGEETDGAAGGTRGMRRQPLVDAVVMEAMVTSPHDPNLLPFLELRQADGALRCGLRPRQLSLHPRRVHHQRRKRRHHSTRIALLLLLLLLIVASPIH